MPVYESQPPFIFLGGLYDADRGGGAMFATLDVPGPYANVLRAPEAHQRIPSAGKSLCTYPDFSYEPGLTSVILGAL